MARASYQNIDNIRLGKSSPGRFGRIEDSLRPLLKPGTFVPPIAREIGMKYPSCRSVVKLLAEPGRRVFQYRDTSGNLQHGSI